MRKLTWKNKTYILNEQNYAQLLKRFDVSKIKDGSIDVYCICSQYQDDSGCCYNCPFAVDGNYYCIKIAEDIIGELKYSITLFDHRVKLIRHIKGKEAVTKIRSWLLSAEKVSHYAKRS